MNALTVNADDWFQVDNLRNIVKYDEWSHYESRFELNANRILQLLNENGSKATFFILGWLAERYPNTVRRIYSEGHEIATQGFINQFIGDVTRDQFKSDLTKSIAFIEELIGDKVIGYRAPHFSLMENTTWVWPILSKLGILYDSSIFPVKHVRYGFPTAPRFPFYVSLNGTGNLIEYPLSTIKILKSNIPIAGGGYLRLFPYWFIRLAIKKLNAHGQPANIYFHPWELDKFQPKAKLATISKIRHYGNIGITESKLRRLMTDFQFVRIRDILSL